MATRGIDIDSLPEFPAQKSAWSITPSPARVTLVRYNSSADPRGHIPCYQLIMQDKKHYLLMDQGDGFVHWTQVRFFRGLLSDF